MPAGTEQPYSTRRPWGGTSVGDGQDQAQVKSTATLVAARPDYDGRVVDLDGPMWDTTRPKVFFGFFLYIN